MAVPNERLARLSTKESLLHEDNSPFFPQAIINEIHRNLLISPPKFDNQLLVQILKILHLLLEFLPFQMHELLFQQLGLHNLLQILDE